jgi:hypothetical protein
MVGICVSAADGVKVDVKVAVGVMIPKSWIGVTLGGGVWVGVLLAVWVAVTVKVLVAV